MSTSIDHQAVARATRGLFSLLSPEQLVEISRLSRDRQLEQRVEYLAHRANEDELTPEERAEYLGYVEANSLLAMLSMAAREQLAQR